MVKDIILALDLRQDHDHMMNTSGRVGVAVEHVFHAPPSLTLNMDQFVAELRKIPPVTRSLLASSLGITLPVLLNILSPYKVLFVKELVFKKLEVSPLVER